MTLQIYSSFVSKDTSNHPRGIFDINVDQEGYKQQEEKEKAILRNRKDLSNDSGAKIINDLKQDYNKQKAVNEKKEGEEKNVTTPHKKSSKKDSGRVIFNATNTPDHLKQGYNEKVISSKTHKEKKQKKARPTVFDYEAFQEQYQNLYGRRAPKRLEAWFGYAKKNTCAVDVYAEARHELSILQPAAAATSTDSEQQQEKDEEEIFDVYRQIEKDLQYFRDFIYSDPKTGLPHGDPLLAKKRREEILSAAENTISSRTLIRLHRIKVLNGIIIEGLHKTYVHLPGLQSIAASLPDMTIYISIDYDEPRVLAGKPGEAALEGFQHNPQKMNIKPSYQGQPSKQIHEDVCGNMKVDTPEESFPAPHPSLQTPDSGTNSTNSIRNSSEDGSTTTYTDMIGEHGAFLAPASFEVTYSQVPIFSQAKINSCYRDIIFPSPYYISDVRNFLARIPPTTSWAYEDRKAGSLFWRGSNTGLYSRGYPDTNHQHALRQRMVLYSKKHIDIVDAAMIAYIQMDSGRAHADHVALYGPEAIRVSETDVFAHRHLLDMDGNSLSRRFLPFLLSGSLTFRAGVFTDWLMGMVRPYWHYIPVDLKFEKLPERFHYYSAGKEGQDRGKRVAETAKQFAKRRARSADMLCYTYRLLIEYAEIFYPEEE